MNATACKLRRARLARLAAYRAAAFARDARDATTAAVWAHAAGIRARLASRLFRAAAEAQA